MIISFINTLGEKFSIISPNYILSPNWEGFGSLPITHQLIKAPYQDGKTLIDSLFEERNLSIEFTIIGSNRQQIFDRRKIVERHFNPKLGIGILEWQQDDGTKLNIDCIPSDIIFASGDGQSEIHQCVIIPFIAPNPFWYDPTYIERTLVGFEGGWSFPWSFPISFGVVSSTIIVRNEGNVNTPVVLTFHGAVTDPVLKNLTTNEEIRIIKEILDGQILIINTAFGQKSVTLNGENAFEYVDPESVFWQLIPGDNTLKYTATSEGEHARCLVLFYHRYSGA